MSFGNGSERESPDPRLRSVTALYLVSLTFLAPWAFFFLFFSICFPSRLFGGDFAISIRVPLSGFGPALALSVVSNRPGGSDSTSGVERSRTPETRSHMDHVVHGKRVVFPRSIHQEGSESGADKARMEATAPSAATPFMASSVYSS